MNDKQPLELTVECYAGHRGEQEPRRVYLSGRLIRVQEILDRWLAPDHRYFKLRGDDGAVYIVRHDERHGMWELTFFRHAENTAPDIGKEPASQREHT